MLLHELGDEVVELALPFGDGHGLIVSEGKAKSTKIRETVPHLQ
jgi:hypothetical protein